LPVSKAIDELMFKTRKKWERRKKMLKRAEARATRKASSAANDTTIDLYTSKMKKLEADMGFLNDERQTIEDNQSTDRDWKSKKN